MVSVELRRPLLGEERLEYADLAESDYKDRQSDEGGPDHYALIQVLGPLPTLQRKIKTRLRYKRVPKHKIVLACYLRLPQSVVGLIINDGVHVFVNLLSGRLHLKNEKILSISIRALNKNSTK